MDSALPSPSFVVDLDRVRANSARMRAVAREQGLLLRPHAKTHKTREGLRLQLGDGTAGDEAQRCVVSTLREAEFFAEGGVPDILYGALIEPSKYSRAWALHCSLPCFSVLADSLEAVASLEAFCSERIAAFPSETRDGGEAGDAFIMATRRLAVFLAVDATQYGREGVSLEGGESGEVAAVAVARAIAASRRLKLAGLYSHSGNSYNTCSDKSCAASKTSSLAHFCSAATEDAEAACACPLHDDARAGAANVALRERDAMLRLARLLKTSHAIAVPLVSIGATPAASSGAELGLRGDIIAILPALQLELHPGNYIFFDRQQVESGSCRASDVACFVLARVVARYAERGEVLIDAGGCAMHKDPAGLADGTWGCLLEDPTLVLRKMTQELSVVGRAGGAAFEVSAFPPGRVVRVVPNHSCMTAAQHEVYHVVEGSADAEGGRRVVAVWRPAKFW